MDKTAIIRKLNAIVSALLMISFVAHGITNGLYLVGVLPEPIKGIAHITELICWIHIVIGVFLTAQGIIASARSGALYPSLNRRYLAVRISGILIAVLMLQHVIGASHAVDHSVVPMNALVSDLLLVVSIAVHVACNIRPQFMSLGLPSESATRVAVALLVLIALMGLAFLSLIFMGRVI